ncbi:helix-turn-helix domain-containing protein [Sphingomonas sp. MMS24-J13]|uniref:AraC-like ligand-binding domain-containing protein n=1 Tax=Sphingomonas sp. MMS24-J13 TaxID=3238686 RepID=UPI00385099EE
MALVERFTTHDIEPARRLAFWNELAERTFGSMRVDSPNPAFRGEMLRWRLGELVLIQPRSEASTVHRAGDPNAGDRVVLHLQSRGMFEQVHRGKTVLMRPGDMSVCASNEPYRLSLSNDHATLAVELPRAALDARIPHLDDRIALAMRGTSPAVRLLHDFLLSLWRQGDQSDAEPAWQESVSTIFLDLLALALREDMPIARDGGHATRRLNALIDARLTDPALSTAMLADELGISPRSVQNLFAQRATTPSAYILRRRLERAAELLSGDPDLSITALAFELGFNDSAYFTRCFRQQFGAPPSAWRARH